MWAAETSQVATLVATQRSDWEKAWANARETERTTEARAAGLVVLARCERRLGEALSLWSPGDPKGYLTEVRGALRQFWEDMQAAESAFQR